MIQIIFLQRFFEVRFLFSAVKHVRISPHSRLYKSLNILRELQSFILILTGSSYWYLCYNYPLLGIQNHVAVLVFIKVRQWRFSNHCCWLFYTTACDQCSMWSHEKQRTQCIAISNSSGQCKTCFGVFMLANSFPLAHNFEFSRLSSLILVPCGIPTFSEVICIQWRACYIFLRISLVCRHLLNPVG